MKTKLLIIKVLLFILALVMIQGNTSCTKKEADDGEEAFLSFTTPGSIKPATAGEKAEIVITASGGNLPYEFYVIPETQWMAGDMMHEMLLRNDFSRLYRYRYSRNLYGSHICKIDVAPGTPTVPRYYWVAVQDKSESAPLSGSNMLAWWKRVSAYGL